MYTAALLFAIALATLSAMKDFHRGWVHATDHPVMESRTAVIYWLFACLQAGVVILLANVIRFVNGLGEFSSAVPI